MPQPSPIPNLQSYRRIYAGTETTRGTFATPTYRMYGALIVNKRRPLQRRDEDTGSRLVQQSPVYGPSELDGTYSVPLTYEDYAILPRYGVEGSAGAAPVDDGNTVHGYTRTYAPTGNDDIDSLSIEHGFDGIVFRSSLGMWNEFTVRADIDDANAAWMWDSRLFVRSKELQLGLSERVLTAATSTVLTPTGGGLVADALIGQYAEIMAGPGAGQVREIIDNDTTTITVSPAFDTTPTTSSYVAVSADFTTGISDRTRETVDAEGTVLYIGEGTDALGTHQQYQRFKAFSVTFQNNIAGKRMLEDVGQYSAKLDVGAVYVTAQLTLEFDEWREYRRWEQGATRVVRIQKEGSTIDTGAATKKLARIDLPDLYYEQMSEEVRNNNIVATFAGGAYIDTTLGYNVAYVSKTTLATLP